MNATALIVAALCGSPASLTVSSTTTSSETATQTATLPQLTIDPPPPVVVLDTITTTAASYEKALLPKQLRHVKYSALIDGGWSALMTVAWAWSARSWDTPQPEGALSLLAVRVLYGTTWSVLVAGEIWLFKKILGDDFDRLSQGRIRNDWVIGFDVPGPCSKGKSGCGLGLGGYSEISVRIEDGDVPIELVMSGGWIQGRFDDDGRRTITESTWVQAPLIMRAHLPYRFGPVAIEGALGIGGYFGMHNGHMHPRSEFADEFETSFIEITPLHVGAGPGMHAKLWLTFFDTLRFGIEADAAVFAAGKSFTNAPPWTEALQPFEDRGVLWWRRAAVSVGLHRRVFYPVEVNLRLWGAKLAPGSLWSLGHRAAILSFGVPFDFSGDDEDEDEDE